MKKFDFSKIRNSIFLMLFMMIAFVGFSQGTDDFGSLTTSSSYSTITSTNGWSCVNTAVNATTYTIGTCERKYVIINGKTSAVGSITSPELTGGCGTLSLSYGNVYSESNGVSFKIQVKNLSDEVLYETIVTKSNSEVTKGETYNFTTEVNQAGDFKIFIQNLSPSASTSNKDRLAISCIEWTAYGAPAAVAAPTCTPSAGMFYAAQEVALASATEGATIYYSMDDGATPYLLYNDPINITEAVTLKAFAVLGEDTSAVTTAAYTFPVEAATIAELKANGIQNTIYKVAEDVIVIYQNGQYLFVQDENDAVVVYGNVTKEYNSGDVIADGFFGKYTIFKQLTEMTPVADAPAFSDGVAGTAVEPTVATVNAVLNNYATWEAKLVKFENVVFTDATHFAQDGETLVLYNKFGTSVEMSAGSEANVTGLVARYNDEIQIYPRTNADVELLSSPAAELPYRLDFDEYVDENLVIDNGTYTNKWYVGQAQDFDNNKLYISSSNGRTNKYNTSAASTVVASRDLNIPANGAIVTFDCRYMGETNDHLRFVVSNNDQMISSTVASTNNEWTNVTLSIPSEMAGVVTISFVWENDGNGGEQYPAAIDNIYIYESSCSQPAALSTTVDTTSATITWSGDAEAYLLQYKLADHSEWYSVNTNDTTVTLTDLQGNSNYDVRVQSVCEEYSSAWTEGSFTVDCQDWISDSHRDYKVIGTEAGASTHSNIPFYGLYNYAYSQQIVDANEINASSGTIYSVSFKCSTPPATSTSTGGIRIWLANTDKATFSSNTDYINPSELTEVYVEPSYYAYQSDWNEFVFTTPFEYTGGNLVVAYYEGKAGWASSYFYVNSTEGNKSIYHYSDNESSVSYTDPASNSGTKDVIAYRNVMKFDMATQTISCGDPILCPSVTNVVIADTMKNAATITWTPGSEDQNNFIVEYKAANDADWIVADSNISAATYTLTGLTPATYYIVRVKANCGDYNMSEATLSEEFRTLGVCDPVTEISHYNLATTAVLTWTPGSNETAWTVKFKPTEAAENAWVEIPVQGQATASLGGLQAQTDYDVQILALCEGDPMGLSDWAPYSFTSACASVDIPVTYTLKSNDHDCWEANAFDYTSYGASTSIRGASLISPAFNIPREGEYFVSFDVEGDYQLLASYRGTRDDRFEVIAESTAEEEDGKVIVAIPEEYLGRGVNFKFICTSESVIGGYLQVSNFKINACPFETANLTVANVTANTAVLSWNASELATNFQIKLGEDNFIDVEGATTYTLTDLEENTAYTASVRTKCGEDTYGEWSAAKTFTTPCAAYTVPYFEGFESGYTNAFAVAGCISQESVSGGNSWTANTSATDYNRTPRTGSWNAYLRYSNSRWMYIPMHFEANKQYIFEMYARQDNSSGCSMMVAYGTNNTSSAMTNTIVSTTSIGSSFVKLSESFTPTATGDYYVGIYAQINGSPWYVSIDDISIIEAPTCGVPTIAVNSSAVATIIPNEIGEPASYDLMIGEETQTVTETTVDLTTIFTLASNTEYAVSVRAHCGEEDQSAWSAPVNFTTPCAALALPYTEDFSNYTPASSYSSTTGIVMPDCWTSDWTAQPSTSSNYCPKVTNSSTYKPGDGNYLYFMAGGSYYSYYQDPTVVVLPEFDADLTQAMISFRARCNNSSYSTYGTLYLGYVNAANAFTSLCPITCATSANAPLQTIELNTYTIPEGSKLAFKADYTYSSSYSNFHVGIDDIAVEMIPTCGVPTIAVNSSAVATITPNTIGTPESYDLMIGEETVNVTTTTVDLTTIFTTLAPNTEYAVSVRAHCGEEDQSAWSAPVNFTTPCMAVALPLFESFESSTCPADCWTVVYASGNPSLNTMIHTQDQHSEGQQSFRFSSYSTASDYNQYLITPKLADHSTLMLSFDYRKYGSYSDNIRVGYSTTTNDIDAFTWGPYLSDIDYNSWKTYNDVLPAEVKYVAINYYASCQYYVYVDNFNLWAAPTCFAPTDLAATAADTTAQLTWTDEFEQAGYKVQYRLAGENTWQEVTGITATNYTLRGLQPLSDYEVRVMAVCAADDESEATETVNFSTICLGGYYEGVSIGEGTSTSYYLPSYINYKYSLTQQIYTAREMKFTGDLNSVSFYNTSTSANRNLSVYLVHTEKTSFSSTSDLILVRESDKVFEGNVNFVQNDWTTIEFTAPFAYNGTDNVALIVDDNTGSYSDPKYFRVYDAGSNRSFSAYSDNYNGNPMTGEYISSMNKNIGTSLNQVRFNGGRILTCPPTCPEPTALQAANVTANAATITWTAGGSETAWNVEYGKAGFTPGEGTMVEANEASIELTGLEMGVGYDVYVQANCAADDQSTWVGPANFATVCEAIATLPYTQDFEGETFEPACWSQNQLSGSEPWEQDHNYSNHFAVASYEPGNSVDLITPVFDLSTYESVMLTFDRSQVSYDGLTDKLGLYYRTAESTDWTLLQEYAEETSEYPEILIWKSERFILPEAALAENVQFAFRGTGLDGYFILLDNVVVMETPDCYVPTNLSLNDVTTTTATISWLAGDEEQAAWNVQYGEHNFTLGEGAVVAVDTTMAELTALMGGTAYDVYVQSVCDEDHLSTWAGPIVIATECVTINTLPYTQDFESDFFEPLCWSQEQLSGSYPWNLYSDNTGNLFAGFPYNRNNSANLITPKFNLTSYESVMLSFEHVQMPDAGVVDKLELFYRTSEDADWTLIKEYTEATSDYVDYLVWKNETMILPEEALTDNVQFAFRGTGIYGYNIYLDNVVLMETPCGYIEDLAVAQDSMTDTRAYITWKGVAQEYALEYQEAGDETWTDVPVSAEAQWLTDLTPSTNYNVRVKAVCGEEEAEYSDEYSFTTLCLGYLYDCPLLHNDLTAKITSDFRVACEINDPVVVKVTNNAYLDTITSLNLYYTVNREDTVAETLTLTTPLCFQGETTYTFNEIPVFNEGYNTVKAWVEYNDNVYNTNTIGISVLAPIDEYPYYKNLAYTSYAEGWNAYDVNEDGVTMFTSGQGVTYSYNDTLDANDWMITPCFYFEPGKYVISYSYNAHSVLKESFEFWYGNGAKVADMTTMVGSEEFSGTAVNTATYDFDVTEAGVYNFGFKATSLAGNLGFDIRNLDIEPVNIVTVTTDGNGTVTPSGDVYVNYDENLTLNIVPNVNYHLSAIYVDGEQVVGEDPYASRFVLYTLEHVTEPHNVFVEFKLEFHTHKIVSNYNPTYDQNEGGYFVPATSDTTIKVSDHTVFFAPNEHYHFNSLTLSEMDEESPVDFTDSVVYDETTGLYAFTFYNLTVPEYFVNAKFRRDTVNIHYDILTGQGYADASPRLIAGDSALGQYDTWVDYDLHGEFDTTITVRPAGDYHLVDVFVNGEQQTVESDEFHYTFSNVTETQNVDVKFGYQVTTSIRNYLPTYLGSDEIRGTIAPDTQLVAEGEPTVVYGTIQEHFHLYNIFVDGVDMIDQVVFDGYNYSLTIDSTIANYNIEAVVKIDTFGIHYNVMGGQGYADQSDMLVAPAEYTTWINYTDDFMMNVTPATGFSIGNVVVDGVDMYTANNYLFEYVIDEHYVDVTFIPNDYTITTNAYGYGEVSTGIEFTYDPANPVDYQFIAAAEEGYHISAIFVNNEEQDLSGITNVYTLLLNDVADNYVINAHFEINTYNMVSEAISYGGTITPEGTQVVNYGTDMLYEMNANEGYYISTVISDNDTVEFTQNDNVTSYSIDFTNISEDHFVSVSFSLKHFTITAEVDEQYNHGTIDGVSSFSGEFSYGSHQTLNFIPEDNYQVSDVVVDGQSVGAVAYYEFVNISANHEVVVSFAPVQYTLTATSNVDACTITPASTTVQAGSNVNYSLTVATGYHLLNVIANGEEVNVVANAFTISNVQEDYEIFANFAPNYVTVTVEQPAHATITPGTMTYAYGATPSYVIIPEAGYDVTAVHAGNALVNVTYNNGIGSFTLNPVTADLTLTATTAIKTFTITATQSAHGTISPAAVQTVNYGGNVTYTITPDDYYELVDVLIDGSSRGAISTYTFSNVTANHTIEAVFEAACITPSRLSVVYLDTTSATLTWEGNAASYEVRYRAAGETAFTTQTVTTNTITLNGLTPNTLYAWGVKANCTATMSSDWAESAFTTNAVIPPYVGISTADLSSIKVYSHLNNVYIVNENGIAIDNVTIYNIFGAQVYSGNANNNPEVISLNVANGNYIVRLSTENGVGVYKLSIVR